MLHMVVSKKRKIIIFSACIYLVMICFYLIYRIKKEWKLETIKLGDVDKVNFKFFDDELTIEKENYDEIIYNLNELHILVKDISQNSFDGGNDEMFVFYKTNGLKITIGINEISDFCARLCVNDTYYYIIENENSSFLEDYYSNAYSEYINTFPK